MVAERQDSVAVLRTAMGDRRNLAEQAADAIVEAISTGHFQPGERLVEAELSAALGISRIPLREALKVLDAQGILVHSQNRGVSVAAFGDKEMRETRRIRTDLETVVALEVAPKLRADPAIEHTLRRIIQLMRLAVTDGDRALLRTLDISFHRELCAVSGNRVILTLWEALARYTRIIFGRETRAVADLSVIPAEHEELLRLLLEGDDAAIRRGVEEHINLARL